VTHEQRPSTHSSSSLWAATVRTEDAPRIMEWHAVYASYFRESRTILDVGCGNGLFLELMRAAGKKGVGVDIDPCAVAECKKRGIDARLANATEILGMAEKFDAIHACHLLEYMSEAQTDAFLSACKKILPENGILVLRTSNWNEPLVRDEMFWTDSDHVRPYPLALLEKHLARHGFDIEAKGFENRGPKDLFVLCRPGGTPSTVGTTTEGVTAAKPTTRIRVAWEGTQFVHHSLARVNREMVLGLLDQGGCDITVIPYEPHRFSPAEDPRFSRIQERIDMPLEGPTQVHVRHQWPPSFTPPREGRWVVMQPWEYGAIPKEWVTPLRDRVDEIWVPSRAVKEAFATSGIPEGKIFVVPNGVNTDQFRPDHPPVDLPIDGSHTRFLYVGGTIWRKGIDVLLDAYCSAFTAADAVTLVIKDMGQDTIYRKQGMAERIREMKNDPTLPGILYLEDELDEKAMAGLYTACHCLVHPFRGEGYALPVAEAAASGLPVIVTRGGAPDDYLTDDIALWVRARKQSCNIGLDLASPGWILEPDRDDLMEQMRTYFENRAALTAKAHGALASTRERISWRRAATIALERIQLLSARTTTTTRSATPSTPPRPVAPTVSQPLPMATSSEPLPAMGETLTDLHAETRRRSAELKRTLVEMKRSDWAQRGIEERNPRILSTISDAHRVLAKRFLEAGELDQAREEITQALTIQPHHAPDLLVLGNIYFMDGQESEAETCFKKAADLEPGNASAHYNLGMVYRCRNRTAEAASCFEKAVATGETDAEVYNNLGVLKFELGDAVEAEANLKKALGLQPDHLDSIVNLSTIYRTQRRIAEAVEVLRRGIHFLPDEEALTQELESLRRIVDAPAGSA